MNTTNLRGAGLQVLRLMQRNGFVLRYVDYGSGRQRLHTVQLREVGELVEGPNGDEVVPTPRRYGSCHPATLEALKRRGLVEKCGVDDYADYYCLVKSA